MNSHYNNLITMNDNSDPYLELNLKGHSKTITGLCFNPNGNGLVSSSLDHSLMLWNITDIKDTRCYKLSGHNDAVTAAEFSKNAKLIVSCSKDRTVKLWVPSVRGGSACFKAHTSSVNTVNVSPTNDKLITGSHDKCVKEWDLEYRRFLSSFVGHNNWVLSAKYSPYSDMIASCADDRTLRIWDAKSGETIHNFSTGKSSGTQVAFHPNNECVAMSMASGSVRVYDLRTRSLQQHYVLHEGHRTTAVCWHPVTGAYLLSAGSNGTLQLIDVVEGRPLYTLEGTTTGGAVEAVAFSEDGERFASAGEDKHIMMWKTNFIRNSAPSRLHDTANGVSNKK